MRPIVLRKNQQIGDAYPEKIWIERLRDQVVSIDEELELRSRMRTRAGRNSRVAIPTSPRAQRIDSNQRRFNF
jgi:hypothetical protein